MMDLFSVLIGPVSRMSHVTRYSSFPVHRRENVAEHSWWVCFISYLISEDLNCSWAADPDDDRKINTGVLLSRALVHDLDESLSGDLIRSFKYSDPDLREAVRLAAERNMKELTSKMSPVGAGVLDDWRSAKKDPEGDIVAFADMVSVVLYCREEYIGGNQQISRALHELYTNWMYKWHDHPWLGVYADQIFPGRRYRDALVYAEPAAVPMSPIQRDASEGPTAVVAREDWRWPGERVPLS